MLDNLRENFKQYIYYGKEYRIAAPQWFNLSENITLEDIADLLQSPHASADSSPGDDELQRLAIEMGTNFWRLQRRLIAQSEIPPEMKRMARDLESMGDALKQAGLEIKDHTGEYYDGHMALKVIAFQPTVGITREIITETIKPTIYRNDSMVQMGEVIVAVSEPAAKAS
jgi:hypothetical protein